DHQPNDSHAVAQPLPGDPGRLHTTAIPMPRSVGVFRKAGWRVVAYPVDYDTPGNESFSIDFSFRRGLGGLTDALRECLGLLFYRLTGRTDDIFPGPEQ
ncbi:MAG: YdcF family protein, partial [Rhodospirillaceae bacterium]